MPLRDRLHHAGCSDNDASVMDGVVSDAALVARRQRRVGRLAILRLQFIGSPGQFP